ITVAGLMDNSLVKIADINGNIVFQGKSSGGSFIWDGCNAGGERVRTGVYLVLASAGDDSSSMAVVSKIMIMN
ncbi:MAG: Por secretion system protein, partial [Paramuribaculum sp.]|nr:Por secretion system protein [Paramuribaculum sp.]